MNNVKDSIGWAQKSWNPITGCKRGCPYCYARRIYERFNKTPFSEMRFYPERLRDNGLRTKKPLIIFVGSMTDIAYAQPEWLREAKNVCNRYQQHTFMFLSKELSAYKNHYWPPNTMQGLTVEKIVDAMEIFMVLNMHCCPRPFLSIEPLLGPITIKIPDIFERIMVGAMTGPGAIRPEKNWIESIRDNAPKGKIYWKRNIRGYL